MHKTNRLAVCGRHCFTGEEVKVTKSAKNFIRQAVSQEKYPGAFGFAGIIFTTGSYALLLYNYTIDTLCTGKGTFRYKPECASLYYGVQKKKTFGYVLPVCRADNA